ncbi:phosphatase PAP2 family protein [Orrella sp. NBD-18]|uniref:Phosphatase PAP2 family protein n=1 Tax=Sheuella amnicola TaxID=2707330 RepID=A0A6B2QYU3_9BURK|nr:phosphatase PAP2 family protein [Sheuella amnicola]NDY83766.1 phosphatase PAP2 family protein [Sheuella amnicola]
MINQSVRIPPWAWGLWVLPLMLWLAVSLTTNPSELFLRINQDARVVPDTVWVFLNLFGNGWFVFALTAPLLVLAPRLLVAGVIGGAITGALSRSIKLTLEMPRPASVLDPSTFHIIGKPLTSLSMPSGHTLTAFSLATALYFSASPEKRKPFIWVFLIAIGAGLARIAVGAHWPADVMAGAAIGLFGGIIGAALAQRLPANATTSPSSWLIRLIGASALLCLYMLLTNQMDFVESWPFQYAASVVIFISILFFIPATLRGRST